MAKKKSKAKKITSKLPIITRSEKVEGAIDFPVQHYSYSSMVKFSTNPIMFRINYLNRDKIESTKNVSSVIGSAFHHAMEVYYRGNPDLMPKDESQGIEFGLKSGMNFLEEYNDGFIEFSKEVENKQKAFDLFTFLFTSYVQEKPYNPKEEIIAVEEKIVEKINLEWRGMKLGMPVPLKGIPDKIVRVNGKLEIKDYKTCRSFSDPEKIDGAKIIQAIISYFLVYAKYGEAPYKFTYEEAKMTKNREGGPQVKEYEIIYEEHELYFDFFFRFYQDMTDALNGKMVYVPNVNTFFDNEVSIIAYIHRLDIPEQKAALMKKMQVENITDLLKKEIQSAGNMRKLLKTIEKKLVEAKNINYSTMNNSEKIQTKMMEHGILLKFDSVVSGSAVDLHRFNPSIGLKMSRIENYVADVEQVLGISGIRVLAPIKGSTMVGFEVPRADRVFPTKENNNGFEIAIGQTIGGEVRRFDLRSAPHMLVAGSTGSGKSVFLSSIIEQLGTIPNVDLHLFDPKMVELSMYKHLAKEYEYEAEDIKESLKNLVDQMDDRYSQMSAAKVRNISDMPDMRYKFIIIDEFADLVMQLKETKKTLAKKSKKVVTKLRNQFITQSTKNGEEADINDYIVRLAQKARAAGIHLIITTQRPSVDVVSGLIKANFPVKAVFKTAKAVDSRVVIDEAGAEKLMGKGDMLFQTGDGIERLQGYKVWAN